MEINLFVLLKMYNGYLMLGNNMYYVSMNMIHQSIWCNKVDK